MGYVDSNGNGVWDEGEPLLSRAIRARELGSGGGGSGWLSIYSRSGGYDGPDHLGNDGGDGGGGVAGDPNDPSSDLASIDIVVNIDRPLTGPEQRALDNLIEKILTIDANMKNLSDTETMKIKGREVTGAEAKREWARTDFVINEKETPYSNGTTRGEAAYNNGNPQISFNIDLVEQYHRDYGDAGMNYLVLHDFGHITEANRLFDIDTANSDIDVEIMANDIARAFANEFDLLFMTNPTHGFSAVNPGTFEEPSTDGGGGGGGWGGFEPPMPENGLQVISEF